MLRENELLSVGEHIENNLEGIGRMYGDGGWEDGIFKAGELKGIGVRYNRINNKYTIG